MLVNTETHHCHTAGLGALCAVEQAEVRGSSSRSPQMQVSSAMLPKGTLARRAQTCQLTARGTSAWEAAVTDVSPSGTAQLLPREKMQYSADSIAVFPACISPTPISLPELGRGGTNLPPKCYLKPLRCQCKSQDELQRW